MLHAGQQMTITGVLPDSEGPEERHMPIPPLTIPHRSPTVIFAAAGYGLAILLWLGMEDSTIWPVTVLGAGLALLVSGLTVIAQWAGTSIGGWRLLLSGALLGGAAGSLSAPLTTLLMLIKNAAHSHIYLDYPLPVIISVLTRLPAWTAVGVLLGLGSVFCWVGVRLATRR
jgi:hypothetical protein